MIPRIIPYLFLLALGLIAVAGYARAAVDTNPRVMGGVFCNTAEDMKFVLDNRALDVGAIDLVNQDGIKCVLHHDHSSVFVTSMRFIRADRFDGDTLYLYEATVEGFFFGHVGKRIEPLKQYVYMPHPIDPSHKTTDA